eukprot:CAMPEP_0197451240 /NCGR_PEP_ID=MMETSP1175-20131217/28196_1 /TAXON_ID=1003142 /ORGANISM="Triceratium dubium, Strain CCMP147" /LENGTH=168 /DNA_ID=CAMNT_0042983885 /DNA_START=168 /DNA_END=674 /DNA_ORIENTATION=+
MKSIVAVALLVGKALSQTDMVLPENFYYSFDNGSSNPPKTRRVCSIHVWSNEACIDLRDENDNLIRQHCNSVDECKFMELKSAVELHRIRECEPTYVPSACVGGKYSELSITSWKRQTKAVFVDGSIQECGGSEWGDVCGDIHAYARHMMSTIDKFKRDLCEFSFMGQ